MTCDDAHALVHAYVDGEFDPVEAGEFERHVRACEGCRQRTGFEAWFKEGLRDSLPAIQAPEGLRSRVRQRLREEAAPKRAAGPLLWAATPAALAVAALLALVVMTWDTVDVPPTTVVDAVQMHRRALPAEMGPNDPEDVRRWFFGKVGFPVVPPRPQPAAQGATPARFLGARVSHVGRFPAAHMMYDVGGARVSVMAFREPPGMPPPGRLRTVGTRDVRLDRMDGYNVAFGRSGDVTYAVTGAVEPARMVRFLPAPP